MYASYKWHNRCQYKVCQALPPADVEGVGIVKQAFELASSDQELIEFLTSTGCFGNLVGEE
jgi:hypothetical protein